MKTRRIIYFVLTTTATKSRHNARRDLVQSKLTGMTECPDEVVTTFRRVCGTQTGRFKSAVKVSEVTDRHMAIETRGGNKLINVSVESSVCEIDIEGDGDEQA